MQGFFAGTHRRPRWRKARRDERFRIVHLKPGDVRRLSRKAGEVRIPKAGWVRFRWSRAVPGLTVREARRPRSLERKLAKARRGSNRRDKVKTAIARLKGRETDRRKDWCEKLSTDLARRFDVIHVEDLNIRNMTRSARGTIDAPGRNVTAKTGLNRGISKAGWGLLVRSLEQKAPGRVEKIPPVFTSQCCSACGHIARESRQSQVLFLCVACGYAGNADVNAAKNIAAGHAVKARRGDGTRRPATRGPQLTLSA